MIQKVSAFIKTKELLSMDRKQLVALSGGADSVALLRVLLTLGYDIEAMHCNFHLRGEESNRDEEFCKLLCDSLNVPLHLIHFDTKAYASLHHVSIEMAARELRYGYFRQLREDLDAESICVAHHKDDCAETLLMNCIRGTGVVGLTAIRPKNGEIVRPLLCVTRAEIEDYLATSHQSFVTDSTNLIDDVKRNKIRLDIMPLLRSINPSVIESFSATAQHVNDALPFMMESLEKWESKVTKEVDGTLEIDIKKLKDSPSPSYLVFHILSKRGFSAQTTSEIAGNLDSQTGRQWLSGNMIAVIDRGRIIVAEQHETFREMRLPIEGNYNLPDGHKLVIEIIPNDGSFVIDRSAAVAQLDASSVAFPLTIREVQTGDRFAPFGMRGSKLVSDYLTDRKRSILEKRRQLCLVDATGNIIWLVGERISNRNCVTKDTIKVLRVRYK